MADEKCASCGTAGGDDVTLKNCTACYLVKYCGVECQRNHRPQHKRACKKRAAELKDEVLFKQPESSYVGDCPICCLPMPVPKSQDTVRSSLYACCSKVVCNGCIYANYLREFEARLPRSCPFCRHPTPKTDEESHQLEMKRIEANDPVALCNLGSKCNYHGAHGTAMKHWEKAAEFGHADSHYQLACVYHEGRYGVEKDMKKYMYHTEQAAIGGHNLARHNLGVWELDKYNANRAVKHFIIASNLGHDESMETLKRFYSLGVVSKEDLAAALHSHNAAVDATKSPQRDAAEEYRKTLQIEMM